MASEEPAPSDSTRTRDPPPPQEDGDVASDNGSSVPSTLYARCTITNSQALNARRLRQAVDADVRFLQNRLAKLRAEEQRARSEVDSIKKKTQEVSDSKQRHDTTASTRRRLRDHVDYSKRREAALIALNKERQAKAVWAAKQKVIQDRRDAVLAMQKQKEINECRVKIQREEDRDQHVKQRESIRQLHELARTRREREAEQRREAAREQQAQRLEADQREREEKERLAAQLIAQEAQLIYRLRRMHDEKQGALNQLADAVATNSNNASQNNAAADGSESSSPSHRRHGNNSSDDRLPPRVA